MKSLVSIALLGSIFLYTSYGYNGSTTAAVTVAGGIIKAQHTEVFKKYKRKDCPICKGKGWYISGDDITKVDCGYCEPEVGALPKANKEPVCTDKNCRTQIIKR